ncbi:DUF6876 family protein [Calothrix sp. NIES-2098]|uniref:DUF6876 family protein n=1 Tax=Calothrix sp. NIES-2098 TaxID=1954171 RepID=UPI000B5F5DF9|nr:hypothetical protein NIES2098_12850 [Calothrix sp. NIES-2098]
MVKNIELIKSEAETKQVSQKKLKSELAQFWGTTMYYKHPLFPYFFLTDGTHYLREEAKCHWLFDRIAVLQRDPAIESHPKLQEIQFWILKVRANKHATLVCEWDKGQMVLADFIPYTDFPLAAIKLFVQPLYLNPESATRSGWVCHLPSEY